MDAQRHRIRLLRPFHKIAFELAGDPFRLVVAQRIGQRLRAQELPVVLVDLGRLQMVVEYADRILTHCDIHPHRGILRFGKIHVLLTHDRIPTVNGYPPSPVVPDRLGKIDRLVLQRFEQAVQHGPPVDVVDLILLHANDVGILGPDIFGDRAHLALGLADRVAPETAHIVAQDTDRPLFTRLLVGFAPLRPEIFAHIPESQHEYRQRKPCDRAPPYRPIEHQQCIGDVNERGGQAEKCEPIDCIRIDIRSTISQYQSHGHCKRQYIEQQVESRCQP